MDLIHRLNPFHHRPPSSLRNNATSAPTPSLPSDKTHNSTIPSIPPEKHSAALNIPHHARPSSSLENPFPSISYDSRYGSERDQISTPTASATYTNPSIDSTILPSLYDERHLTRTPTQAHTHSHPDPTSPLPASGQIKGHKRAPSILRSLAHHPSLSALKNRSKRRKRKDVPTSPVPVPVMPSGFDQEDGGSVGRRLRKKSLKVSRSVPRDMRLRTEIEDEPLPPLPTAGAPLASYQAHSLSSSQSTARYDVISPSGLPKRTTSIRRKPAPSPSPELLLAKRRQSPAQYQAVFGEQTSRLSDDGEVQTPESLQFGMRFDLDFTNDFQADGYRRNGMGSPYALEEPRTVGGGKREYGLGVGTPGRRRYLSFDERSSARTTENRAGRHLSTPASDGSPARSSQHQEDLHHLRQNELYAQSLYADSTTFFASHITPAPNWTSDMADDGLGMFVKKQDIPSGTPGGKKEDLKRGAFVDGAKHEPDAVRFFSRDLYAPASATPPSKSVKSPHRRAESDQLTPTRSPYHRRAESSPAASPIRLRKQAFDKAAKRSSSPFEVKLAPSVTKRMSLDAFGTPTPPRSDDDHGDALEEVLENVWEDEMTHIDSAHHNDLEDNLSFDEGDQVSDTEGQILEHGGLDAHQSHHLSTITESPSSQEISAGDIPIYITPELQTRSMQPATEYFTSNSPALNDQGLPTPASYSPSPLTRKYLSAPPLGITPSLLQAHSDHTQALKDQLRASEVVIDVLRGEIDELRSCMETEKEARQSLAVRTDEAEDRIEELSRQCEGKEAALDQLRQAMVENEEFFDDLQEAHDALAEQCTSLIQDKAELEHAREGDRVAQEILQSDLSKLQDELSNEKLKSAEMEAGKRELEGVIFELRRELKWTETQLTEKDDQLAEERSKSSEVRTDVARLTKELSAAKEAIESRNAEIAQMGEKKAFLVAKYQGQIGALELELKNLGEQKEAELSSLRRDLEAKHGEVDHERQSKVELQKAENEKDDIISYLRELLASEQSTSKEAQDVSLQQTAKLASLESELASQEESLKAANVALLNKDATIEALNEKVSVTRYERNEKHFEAEVELNQLRERMEEVTRDAAEREWAAREGREMMARLMEGKRVWEEEREELVDMLNRDSADESSLSSLRTRIDTLTDQLSSSTRQIHHLQAELEDARSSVEHKSTLIHAQEAELSALRLTLTHLEDSMTSAKEERDRQLKDSERVISRLRTQVEELELQISLHEGALRNALTESYSSKVNSADHTSRIHRYLTEIDQLKLSEIKLKCQLDEAQRTSAGDTIKFAELEKKTKALEEDKELLNVALESKTLELTLLQRQTQSRQPRVPSTPLAGSVSASRSARPTSLSMNRSTIAATPSMSKSTSRIPATPTPSNGVDETPLPRRLATSMSSTIRTRRETVSGGSTTRTPLGFSTVHNRVSTQPRTLDFHSATTTKNATRSSIKTGPSSSSKTSRDGLAAASASEADKSPAESAADATTKKVERRSSLPVLRRSTSGGRPGSALGVSLASREESLISIDEDR
ncbi:hypothetical protein I316_06686 [Kwoniella heveanensis BCC8398]|uniref:Uncharacterized protein n=1 Tax=Kwoniella heveanensis BCC8398 TaxID=1296120 RepID=A0A1B9GL51_9TREE|nr:hypothetical protein I316_06686 [Kwoniella heveanensis BCC8398]